MGFPWMYWVLMLKGYRFDIPHLASYAKHLKDEERRSIKEERRKAQLDLSEADITERRKTKNDRRKQTA